MVTCEECYASYMRQDVSFHTLDLCYQIKFDTQQEFVGVGKCEREYNI